MKISRVEIIPVDIPYKIPFRVSYGGVTSGSYILLRIMTDEGIEGVGSSIGFPKIGLNRESAMAKMKSIAYGLLLGQDPLNTETLLSRLDVVLPGNWRIKAHIDYALFDLKGKILNVPVYQLLGGISREKIPLEWIVMMDEPEAQAEMALKYLSAGFKSVKMHVGGDPLLAVKRFKTVREAVGPDVPIAVDMASAAGTASHWNAHDALRVIEALDRYNLHYAEQPVTTHDIEGFRTIKSRTHVPIAGDASADSVDEAYNMIKQDAADIFHALMGRIGGFRKSLQFTHLVDAANLDYAICVLGNGIEHAAGAHFAVSRAKRGRILDELGLIFYLYGGTDTREITEDVTTEINGRIEGGHLYPPKGPGLGVELNKAAIDRYLSRDTNIVVVQE
ncbi:MAG: mandelate racemase/muconate lactonizing enzyme family protein [Desulfobacteraceae bacterium]|nr:MAG: mandelate racemase/muconate lactonizing enzyme family protein [Desulfobacteraceae bacterium]